jgi:ATP-dependent Clp protease ATP-binding subunit ClpC
VARAAFLQAEDLPHLMQGFHTAPYLRYSKLTRMFERFTEDARRVVFFARYEASVLGSSQLKPCHLLLGIGRQDQAQGNRFLPAGTADLLRKRIEGQETLQPKSVSSVDLPLSADCKRAIALAAREASASIGIGHLLLGLLLEERSFAAEALREQGFRAEILRQSLQGSDGKPHD